MKNILFILLLAVTLSSFGGCGDRGTQLQGEDSGYEALFTHGNLHEIEIVITRAEWEGLIQDMKDYAEKDRQGWPRTGNYRKVNFVYKGPAGDTTIEEVGFRTKGNVSRIIPQDDNGDFHRSHFKVRFNETFDLEEGTDEYNERRDRRFCGLRTLNFRWHMSGSAQWGIVEDVSQIRELYCYDLMNRAGVYTSRTGSARLTIAIGRTKHYFGIYTILEPVDQSFLTRRYGNDNDDGNLYKCLFGDSGPATLEPLYLKNIGLFSQEPRIIGVKDWETCYRPTYDLKTNEVVADHSELVSFIDNLNRLSGDKLKEYLDATFEVDRFLKYQAMNVLLGKWDDYWTIGNNYYLYFSSEGKVEFIPCDYDMALGQGLLPMEVRFKGAARFYDASTGIYEWSNHVNDLMAITSGMPKSFFDNFRVYDSPLVEKIFEIEEYREIYEQYFQDFITPANKLFVYSEYEKKFDLMHSLYAPYLDNDTDEGEEMRNDENVLWSVRQYFYERTRSVIEQLGLNEEDYEIPPKPVVKELPPYEYPEELSFEAKETENTKYGFSLKHPSDWTDITATQLYEAKSPTEVTGLFVSVWDTAWGPSLAEILTNMLAEAPVEILALGDTALADGTLATAAEYHATIAGFPMHCYSIGVIRESKWIAVNIWNIDQYSTYDRALFEEIAHTLQFD